MYQDHPDNILGVNNSNNLFDSSAVTADADGSQIERQEYIQQQIAGLSTGSILLKGTAPAATSSTTEVVIAALAGYEDDFFNNQFYMQVLKNANSAGNSPEKQTRKITDYDSATGTFTTDAFSAAIEEDDIILILHESAVAMGRNDADNVFDSSSVAPNADGSGLERLEHLKDLLTTIAGYIDTEVAAIKAITDAIPDSGALTSLAAQLNAAAGYLSGVDSVSNVLGANDSDNGFDSSNVAANNDGSILERAEGLLVLLTTVAEYLDTEIAAIKAVTDVIPDAGALTALLADIAAIKAITDVVPDSGALTALLADITAIKAVTDVVPDAGALTALLADITAMKAVTDVIPDAGALTALLADITAIKAITDVIPDSGALTTLLATLNSLSAAGGDGTALVRKTVTFANTAADVNLFTVTGGVAYKLYAFCTTNCESAGGCNIGVDHNGAAVIADTDATILEANDVWHDASPDASLELESVVGKRIAYGGTIALDVETAKQVDSGAVVFVCIYTPLTSDGAVAAAA
jgi:hypothetical protein